MNDPRELRTGRLPHLRSTERAGCALGAVGATASALEGAGNGGEQVSQSHQANLEGRTVGTLSVGSRAGGGRWNVSCTRCKAQGTAAHAPLMSGMARCQASGCRDDASEIRAAQAATIPKMRRQAVADENAERQAAEDRAQEKAERLSAEFADGHQQLAKLIRERIASQRDDEVFIDPATLGIKMTQAQADAYNASEATAYHADSNPTFYPSRPNREALGNYFSRNGIHIVSAATLAAAVRRLSEYGLLESRPAPAPEVPPQHRPAAYVNLSIANEPEPAPAEPEGMDGWDRQTGEPRHYSDREVALMSSEEYKYAFHLTKAAQTLPPPQTLPPSRW